MTSKKMKSGRAVATGARPSKGLARAASSALCDGATSHKSPRTIESGRFRKIAKRVLTEHKQALTWLADK